MKTNLDSLFKTDAQYEKEGVWFLVAPNVGFLVKRLGGKNEVAVKSALARHYKPKARLIENDIITPDDQRDIMIKMFVEACVVDWKGIEIEGEIADFTKEKAVDLFRGMPDLFNTVYAYASDIANYKVDVGNLQ